MSNIPTLCNLEMLRDIGFSSAWENLFSSLDCVWGLDIETNLSHDHIWMTCVHSGAKHYEFYTKEEFTSWLETEKPYALVAHNGVHFDYPVIKDVWGIDLHARDLVLLDTFILQDLLNPGTMMSMKGLAKMAPEWLGEAHQKGTIEKEQFNIGLTPEMVAYCIQDTYLVQRMAIKMLKCIKAMDHSVLSVWIESTVARIIKDQERNGFKIRLTEAMKLSASLSKEIEDIKAQMSKAFPPRVKEIQLKTKVKTVITPFNPGSRAQVVDRLMELGWKPTRFTTETEAPKLDTEVLIELPNLIDHPLVHLLARYFKIIKYAGMVQSWVKFASTSTNRVHGWVTTNGAVTGRMTHNNPNLGQIPSKDPEFGVLCRSLFTVEEGHTLLGTDAKSLEERMLAHYINIPKYTETVLVDGHTMRRDILGFSQDKAGRDKAKKWFYAWLYGGQAYKLGSIALEGTPMSDAKTRAEGLRTAQMFESKIDGLMALKDNVMWYWNNGKRIPSLDGRMLEMRAKHSMLNTLLQGAGAIVMKVALIATDANLSKTIGKNNFGFVVNVHDEFQTELYFNDSVRVEVARSTALRCFEYSGKALGVRCPIEADAKTGQDWSQTH